MKKEKPSGSKSEDSRRARTAWEKAWGKKCPAGYTVHHKDGDPTNNAVSNLKLITIAEHNTEEKKGKSWKEQGKKVNKRNTGDDTQRKYR